MIEIKVLSIITIENNNSIVYRNYLGINQYPNFIMKGIKILFI